MPKIDDSREFIPVNIAILTVSDTRSSADDRSGDVLNARAIGDGHVVIDRSIVKDEVSLILKKLDYWINNPAIDVIISTGGTGFTGRDVTPEAFKAVFEKEIEGFGELFRWISYQKIGTSTIQSRAVAGVAKGTYLFALPGSTGACTDAWDGILHNQLDIRHRPCNFVEIMPRLREHELSGRRP
ncbi:MAG: molybdenum cofactor biosynthesis protein B [Rhodospirillaceae bacterium]|jgi:molybdenum cofactor biosynthesis protein B|nr:molybdenum cofactor biosynthesis protein B [Rhodospirillaceae bacterium]MBT6307082.1 molybdenum cofactor biosynthesis protein B [Rhodospirillaceae bacterium]MBT7730318.1 molybdenum cofactor biosynthesis protein B [Rhodospirillaceae bacterium]